MTRYILIRLAACLLLLWSLTVLARAETHVFCGLGDALFCQPMQQFAKKTGGKVHYFWQWRAVANDLARRKPKNIRLAGHSCGGSAALWTAEYLHARGVRVQKLLAFDSARIFCNTPPTPPNVAQARCIRQDGILGGGWCSGRNTKTVTRNDLNHMTVGSDPGVQGAGSAFFGHPTPFRP